MTPAEFLTKMAELRDTWQAATKDEEDQTKLFQAGESFIEDMDNALTAAGGHPEGPPPRIRP